MPAAVLFLNHNEEDPTKRRKLAGIRRYADAMRWSVVPIVRAHSRRRSIPALIARWRPIGCIYDCDGAAENILPNSFGDVPVVFANPKDTGFYGTAARVCVDDVAVAEAAFRELSAGQPPAYAVVALRYPTALSPGRVPAFPDFAAWSDVRIEAFRQSRDSTRNARRSTMRATVFLSSTRPNPSVMAYPVCVSPATRPPGVTNSRR